MSEADIERLDERIGEQSNAVAADHRAKSSARSHARFGVDRTKQETTGRRKATRGEEDDNEEQEVEEEEEEEKKRRKEKNEEKNERGKLPEDLSRSVPSRARRTSSDRTRWSD